ncbi:hypothetical protein CC80DRAFT_77523 [Byssothecium circinans]|uniref:Secreted protein n=1 Tax=Byssothecium circinans TaxID=147558 RepID=A0A6A5TSR7_9PLEO|nr:hypothetical protein CC80DRAFT_77523 [Byssothecium circinans]
MLLLLISPASIHHWAVTTALQTIKHACSFAVHSHRASTLLSPQLYSILSASSSRGQSFNARLWQMHCTAPCSPQPLHRNHCQQTVSSRLASLNEASV